MTLNNPLALLTLSGVNTYGGATTITAGTLQLGGEISLPGGAVAANGGVLTWTART